MITRKEFEELKEAAADYSNKVVRAEVQLESAMAELRELGCNSIEEGEAMLKDMEEEAKKINDEFEKEYSEFMGKWSEKLGLKR